MVVSVDELKRWVRAICPVFVSILVPHAQPTTVPARGARWADTPVSLGFHK
jgi:hypothetical protein